MDAQHPPQRIDPPHCGCTDCLTGWSLPLDMRDQAVLEGLWNGNYANATGYTITRKVTYAVER